MVVATLILCKQYQEESFWGSASITPFKRPVARSGLHLCWVASRGGLRWIKSVQSTFMWRHAHQQELIIIHTRLINYVRGWSRAIRRIRSVSKGPHSFSKQQSWFIRGTCTTEEEMLTCLLTFSEAKVLQASKTTHNFKCQICKIVNELPQEAIYLLRHIASQRRNRCYCMLLASHKSVQIQSGTVRISYNKLIRYVD